MTFKIEKNIPLPAPDGAKYPFEEMEIGDSFAFGSDMRSTIASACASYSKRATVKRGHNVKFRVSLLKGQDHGRVWRIE